MALGVLLLAEITTLFYGFVAFAVALALFIFAPRLVRGYLAARSRQDATGKLVRIASWGAVTNERVVVVAVRIILAIFIVLGALVMAHAIGLKTWIFDS